MGWDGMGWLFFFIGLTPSKAMNRIAQNKKTASPASVRWIGSYADRESERGFEKWQVTIIMQF